MEIHTTADFTMYMNHAYHHKLALPVFCMLGAHEFLPFNMQLHRLCLQCRVQYKILKKAQLLLCLVNYFLLIHFLGSVQEVSLSLHPPPPPPPPSPSSFSSSFPLLPLLTGSCLI